jgi:CubicO group peptidase (beta-lactamase class C family)
MRVGVTILAIACAAATLVAADVRPASTLEGAETAARELPRLHSLLVSWHGDLILERYYNGARATRPANIKSVAKSVISALVGIAIDRGLIAGVEQPIATFFPDAFARDDPMKRRITIEDLLTMRSGLESTSDRNYGAWVRSANWVRYVLNRPLVSVPGTEMDYSTGNTHLLSAILTKVTGKSTWQFAQETIARPLGFTLARWPQDPQGIYFGGNEMLLTPRQMLAFGELYLNRGRANGRQIVPERWIDVSFVPRGRSDWSDQQYGYGWWIRELAGYRCYYGWGYGGQFIFVVPDLHLVIVTTSSTAVDEERRGHRRTIYDLVERYVIEPIATRM